MLKKEVVVDENKRSALKTALKVGAVVGGTIALGGIVNAAPSIYQRSENGTLTNLKSTDNAVIVAGAGAGSSVRKDNSNTASGNYSTVSGGHCNTASSCNATVGGGVNNTASSCYATVSGGFYNTASCFYATVSGGYQNTACGINSTVGGGLFNTASSCNAIVGGGYCNNASCFYATVSGGYQNTASDSHATVSGGYQNTASGKSSTVSGGYYNTASGYSIVGGGYCNNASGYFSTVGGGLNNTASGSKSTVSGGFYNTASGTYSTVSGGVYGSADKYVQWAIGGYHPAVGSQVSVLQWYGQTTNNTATEIFLGGTPSNRATLSANRVWVGHIDYIGIKTDYSKAIIGRKHFAISRNGANSTALLATVTDVITEKNVGTAGYLISVTADDTNESLKITVTGTTSETVRWKVSAYFEELPIA